MNTVQKLTLRNYVIQEQIETITMQLVALKAQRNCLINRALDNSERIKIHEAMDTDRED